MRMTSSRFRCSSAAMLTVLAGAALTGGCDRDSAETKTVQAAAIKVHALTGGGAAPAPIRDQEKNFKDVVGSVQPVAQAQSSEKTSASLLLSQAQGSLGDQPLSQAFELERQASDAVNQAFSTLSAWSQYSANAKSASAYDPSEQLTKLAADASKAVADQERLKGTRAQVQREVDDLKAKAKAKFTAADKQLQQYTALADKAQKASATEGLSLLEQARLLKRQADQLRKEGGDFEAQAGKVEPRLGEIDVELTRLANHQKDLADGQARLQQRLTAAKAEASEADSAATIKSNELDKQIADLGDLRSKALGEAYQKAQDAYGKSASAGKAAAADLRGAGRVSSGIAQQMIGDLLFSKARGTGAYAQLLEALANTKDLPHASDYAAKATSARKEQQEFAKAAAEAYGNAKSEFSGAGGGPEVKDRLEKLGQRLDALAAVASGTAADMDAAMATIKAGNPDPAPTEAPKTDTPPAVAANPDETAIRSLFEKYIAAIREGRGSEREALRHYSNPQVKAMSDSQAPTLAPTVRLSKATTAKFGKSLMQILSGLPGMGAAFAQANEIDPLADPSKAESMTAASVQAITITGDSATASIDGLSNPLKFIRVDGQWLINSDHPMLDAAVAMAPQATAMSAAMAKLYDETAGEVESGKYADEAAFTSAFMAKIQQAMMQMMQQNQPKPGGG